MGAEAEGLGFENFCILTLTIKLGKGYWVRVVERAKDDQDKLVYVYEGEIFCCLC